MVVTARLTINTVSEVELLGAVATYAPQQHSANGAFTKLVVADPPGLADAACPSAFWNNAAMRSCAVLLSAVRVTSAAEMNRHLLEKTRHARNAGAVAVILLVSHGTLFPEQVAGDGAADINIPVIIVSQSQQQLERLGEDGLDDHLDSTETAVKWEYASNTSSMTNEDYAAKLPGEHRTIPVEPEDRSGSCWVDGYDEIATGAALAHTITRPTTKVSQLHELHPHSSADSVGAALRFANGDVAAAGRKLRDDRANATVRGSGLTMQPEPGPEPEPEPEPDERFSSTQAQISGPCLTEPPPTVEDLARSKAQTATYRADREKLATVAVAGKQVLDELQDENARLARENDQLTGRVRTLSTEREELAEVAGSGAEVRREVVQARDAALDDNARLARENAQLRAMLVEQDIIRAEIERKTAELERELDASRREADDLEQQLRESSRQPQLAGGERQELEDGRQGAI